MDYSSITDSLANPQPIHNTVHNNGDPFTASQASSKNIINAAIETAAMIDLESVIPPSSSEHLPPKRLFDINTFVKDIKERSDKINKERSNKTVMVNSYAIAHDCIRQAFFSIMNYPARSYAAAYLPIQLKATLGNAVHDFIQSQSTAFTELEVSVKVPSIRTSTRMDALIHDDVIVEIKSCTFKDFETILRQRKPRTEDFMQTVLYKYLLENHLDECKSQTNLRTQPPSLDKYNIRYLQFIYCANDVLSSDASSVSEALKDVTHVKKILDSKHNQFYFINTITIDLTTCDITPHYNWVIGKLNAINGYINTNKIPPMSDPFVSKNCFFCIYKDVCKTYK